MFPARFFLTRRADALASVAKKLRIVAQVADTKEEAIIMNSFIKRCDKRSQHMRRWLKQNPGHGWS